MTKLLMSTSMMTSMMSTQMKHPLAMGMMLLLQTMMTCMISGTMYKSFWFSYILFMIMIGGMLVLFMYMTSLASNEMFYPTSKMMMTAMVLSPTMMYLMPDQTNNKEMNTQESTTEDEIMMTTHTMYSQIPGMMTIMVVMNILITLTVVVSDKKMSSESMQHTN
uniref:NADH-ubiquinone oxidoreductase chain 6 n=1 Tax=Reticulitermes dabieshanensis TaxID=2933237 RepID=A0A8T9KM69_9NEOP|nr:NADH dehydrogenase subunit 6 [Reticulitermes dabieshanensis]UOL50336.1 NADH dehydrogenase subunit 6 [Reticulitermes dabieshanensis]